MADAPQSFRNHAKMVPGFHYVATPILMASLVYFAFRAFRDPSTETVMTALFSLGVLLAAFYGRLFPLGVQDRLIRLEERLRLERLLPAEVRVRIAELTTDQLIGLRFASDEEVPELTARVLAGELKTRKAIKAAIRDWRPDHQRV